MGIPPAPRGMPQIEVTFDIDANGILNVSAKDHATNKEQKITITASTGLSKEEAEKMRNDAEAHADEDKKKLAEIEARNILDSRVYQIEKLIAEKPREAFRIRYQAGGKKHWRRQSRLFPEASSTRSRRRTQQLERASHTLAETLYKTAQASGAQAGAAGSSDGVPGTPGGSKSGSSAPPPGEVIDAEYVDVGRIEEAELKAPRLRSFWWRRLQGVRF